MSYFLAVDAGGTKTEFLLAEDDRELLRVTTGTVKRLVATGEEAAQSLNEAIAHLTAQSGVRMDQIAYTCIGTSGNTVPLVVDWLRANFSARIAGELLIMGDVEIALDAVFPGGRGVLVLSGTGSNVAGRGADGKIVTAGGWGPMLADQGAGHWIGLEALRRGFLAIDEGRTTRLLEEARELWGLPNVKALIEFGNAEPRPRYADLVPRVVQCAEEDDEIARGILTQSGNDLAYLTTLVINRIAASEAGQHPKPAIAVAGSILGRVAIVRDTLMAALNLRYSGLHYVLDPADPVVGALYRARLGR